MTFIQQFKAARRSGVPLLCIRTADPAATTASLLRAYNGAQPPALEWTVVDGIRPVNDAGKQAIVDARIEAEATVPPVDALLAAARLPDRSLLFFHNAHRVIHEMGVSQAVFNLRDDYKYHSKTLAMLCPSIELPIEIQQDVLILDEPLPTTEDLVTLIYATYQGAGLPQPEPAIVAKASDALIGLAAFPAEQAAAMSISAEGIDIDALWCRKREMIQQTRGLSVYQGNETFDDIRGCANVISFMRAVLSGEEPPRAIVWQDEIEKQFAGNGTDLSGVSTEMIGSILSHMQDLNSKGCIFVGPPGAAKSMVAKATGKTAGIPTLQFDLGAAKGGIVGESNQNIRQMLKVVEAVSQGRALWLATCNSIGVLPPELRRRYSFGTFFFDLPTADERRAIWALYVKKFGLSWATAQQAIPADEGWTGAEIRQCCDLAWRLHITLREAAAYVVPIASAAGDQIQRLRDQASGRYISASHPGVYQKPEVTQPAFRRMEV